MVNHHLGERSVVGINPECLKINGGKNNSGIDSYVLIVKVKAFSHNAKRTQGVITEQLCSLKITTQ